MRRGDGRGEGEGREDAAAPGRRLFLGAGLGCALPLIVGTGLGKAGAFLQQGGPGATDADPIWAHIAAEAWRNCREIQGPAGARGEHVRRLASHIELFAVHFRGRSLDGRLDDEVRRMVAQKGREAAAFELVDRARQRRAVVGATRGRRASVDEDPARMAACLEEVASRGITRVLRSRRVALERAAARFDREAAKNGWAVPVSAVGQKPGDDIMGYDYPNMPQTPDFCEVLAATVVACTVAVILLTAAGQIEAVAAVEALQGTCEVLIYLFCRSRSE